MYVLSRPDGRNLRVNDNVWEAALALAFAYGWIPAGTTSPTLRPSPDPALAPGLSAWNRQDYFSRRSQHVQGEDAIALGSALLRGLLFRCQEEHLVRRCSLLRGVAHFAGGGGFTIDSPA